MHHKKVKLISLLFICMTISAIADHHRIYGSKTRRIALLPFKINAVGDLSFLKDGIYDIFMTRLSGEGRAEVISRTKVEEALKAETGVGPINKNTARSIGSRLNADFVLFSRKTALLTRVSKRRPMPPESLREPAPNPRLSFGKVQILSI